MAHEKLFQRRKVFFLAQKAEKLKLRQTDSKKYTQSYENRWARVRSWPTARLDPVCIDFNLSTNNKVACAQFLESFFI